MNDDAVPEHLRPALVAVVRRLAAGDVAGLARDGHLAHPDTDILLCVREYGNGGATLVPLPPEAWDDGDAFAVQDGGVWSVDLPLWTAEEGRNDLTLQADVTAGPHGPVVVITDLHVL